MTDQPAPLLISCAIEAKHQADNETLAGVLSTVATDDGACRLHTDRETGVTVISCTDELHLKTLVERLQQECDVDISVGQPHVAYKETIRSHAERETKLVRQADDGNHYAHVVLRVDPLGSDWSVEFADHTDALPPAYVSAVEQGVRDTAAAGGLAGYSLIGIKVTLVDGSYHPTDSSEMSFRLAAATAFTIALRHAHPVVLEPVMSVEVVVPESFAGPVFGDLNGRCGRIQQVDRVERDSGHAMVIVADVPLAEMFNYAADLDTMTHGGGTFTMEFKTYIETMTEPQSPPPPRRPRGKLRLVA